jgi:hypothetical protein
MLSAGVVTVASGVLTACSEVTVQHATPTPAPTTSSVPTLPPIGFNHRYGTNPVAAADAFRLERDLFSRKQYWEVALRTLPDAAGYVQVTDLAAVNRSRTQSTGVTLVIATEAIATIKDLLAGGDAAQQAFCQQLLDALRADGYGAFTTATVLVYFTEQDRHAQLTWTPSDGYHFTVFDNDLRGTTINPSPSTTPFAAPPSP